VAITLTLGSEPGARLPRRHLGPTAGWRIEPEQVRAVVLWLKVAIYSECPEADQRTASLAAAGDREPGAGSRSRRVRQVP